MKLNWELAEQGPRYRLYRAAMPGGGHIEIDNEGMGRYYFMRRRNQEEELIDEVEVGHARLAQCKAIAALAPGAGSLEAALEQYLLAKGGAQ